MFFNGSSSSLLIHLGDLGFLFYVLWPILSVGRNQSIVIFSLNLFLLFCICFYFQLQSFFFFLQALDLQEIIMELLKLFVFGLLFFDPLFIPIPHDSTECQGVIEETVIDNTFASEYLKSSRCVLTLTF